MPAASLPVGLDEAKEMVWKRLVVCDGEIGVPCRRSAGELCSDGPRWLMLGRRKHHTKNTF
jgi:hypothetical protein